MSSSETARERTVPVALRFEASPDLKESLDNLLLPSCRLATTALHFYITGNEELPVFSVRDDPDASESAHTVIERYNTRVSKQIKGEVPFFHHYLVTQIDHFSSADGQHVNFALHVGMTTKEKEYLRQYPFNNQIHEGLVLSHRQPLLEMQPLPQRRVGYHVLRQSLGRGSAYVTRPTAMTVPRYVDQHSKE